MDVPSPAINPALLTEFGHDWPLEDLAEMGYRALEVTPGDTPRSPWWDRSVDLGLPVVCVNALPDLTPYLSGSLTDAVTWRRRQTLDRLIRILSWMDDHRVPFLVVGASRLAENYQSEEEARDLLISSLRELASQGRAKVLLEAVPFRLFSSSAAISTIIDAVGLPQVGAALDVGHAMLSGEDPIAAAHALGPRLGYVQIRDANPRPDRPLLDQHLPLGRGSANVAQLRRLVNGKPWSVCITAPDATIEEARSTLRQMGIR